MLRQVLRRAALAALTAVFAIAPARAARAQGGGVPISYIFRGLLSGPISGTTYTDAPFTFTFNTNTSDVFTSPSGPRVNNLTPVVTYKGLPAIPPGITIPSTFFVERTGASVLFGLTYSALGYSVDAPLVTVDNGAFATYGLTTSFPETMTTSTTPIHIPVFPGSGTGGITLSSTSFEAIAGTPPVTTTPEPTTWALVAGGLGALGVAVRRRRATV